MLEVKTKKGALKYRLPNIAEGYDYLSVVEEIKTAQDLWKVKSLIMKRMGELVDYEALGYKNYDEVLNDKENMPEALSEISKVVLDDILELIAKKH